MPVPKTGALPLGDAPAGVGAALSPRPFKGKWSGDLLDPVMRIGRGAVLDGDETLAQAPGNGSDRLAADGEIDVGAPDAADRGDDRGGAAGEGLGQPAASRIGLPL